MAPTPKTRQFLQPGRSRQVALKNALLLRANGYSRKESSRLAVANANRPLGSAPLRVLLPTKPH
jgi:hypothetical protein